MKFKLSLYALAIAILMIAIAGCGSNDQDQTTAGNQTDAMFVAGMIPHHQGAIDMAQLGETSAEHPEIKQLSQNIIKSQQAEITQMQALKAQLPKSGMSMMSEDDMSSMMGDVDSLKGADPFDKAFIDAMIPHHRSAIYMAQRTLKTGQSTEVKKLAKAIIAAQTKEIAEMQSWRTEWYGAPLPTGSSGSTMMQGDKMMDGH